MPLDLLVKRVSCLTWLIQTPSGIQPAQKWAGGSVLPVASPQGDISFISPCRRSHIVPSHSPNSTQDFLIVSTQSSDHMGMKKGLQHFKTWGSCKFSGTRPWGTCQSQTCFVQAVGQVTFGGPCQPEILHRPTYSPLLWETVTTSGDCQSNGLHPGCLNSLYKSIQTASEWWPHHEIWERTVEKHTLVTWRESMSIVSWSELAGQWCHIDTAGSSLHRFKPFTLSTIQQSFWITFHPLGRKVF